MPVFVAFGVALVLLLPATAPAQFTQPPVDELRRLVTEKEQEFSAAQAALAAARARLAKTEGKNALAAAEWRKVLAYEESRLKAVLESYIRKPPCSGETLEEAQGKVAIARAWLADVEGRRDDLRVELPKVITYYERHMRRYQLLSRYKAITDQEAQQALNEDGPELKWARDRFAELGPMPTSHAKTGKGGKP